MIRTFTEQARTMSYDLEYLEYLAECTAERIDPTPYADFMEEMEWAWEAKNEELSYFHGPRLA